MSESIFSAGGDSGDSGGVSTATESTESSATETSESSVEDGGNTETTADDSGETQSGTVDTETVDDAAAVEPESTGDPELDDLTKFAVAKGFSAEDLKSESFQRAVKAQREMEKHMGRLQADVDRFKREEQIRASENIERVEAPTLSPIQELDNSVASQLEFECQLHGCANQQELAARFPDVYNNIENIYRQKSKELQQKEIDWHFNQRDAKARAEQQKATLEREYTAVRETARENLNGYRKSNKEFDSVMLKTGSAEQIKRLSDITKIPMDYFHADKKFMDWLVPMASAYQQVKSGELQKKTKSEIEKAIMTAKKAELPGDTRLPDDHEALMFARAQSRSKPRSIFD